MPERRTAGSGRRADDPRPSTEDTAPPPPPEPTRPEVEPNRRHPLHRKIGGGSKPK